MSLDWDWTLIAVSASFHSVAILSTLFRLWYQWYTARMWWDDAWAVLAFSADVACLIVAVLEQPVPYSYIPRFFSTGNWIFSLAYPMLMWATRISILTSMVRVSHPEGLLRHIGIGIGIFFGLMGITMFAFRLRLCIAGACLMTRTIFILQITMDCIADTILSALPVWFLRNMRLSQKRKLLISSAFLAAMVINIVTLVEAVMLFQSDFTSGSIIYEHVKVACSMIVCNLLVIVTFVYRILHRGNAGMEDSIPESSKIEFTTVDLAQGGLSQETVGSTRPATAGSSTWSFRGSRSKISGSISVVTSMIEVEAGEECH